MTAAAVIVASLVVLTWLGLRVAGREQAAEIAETSEAPEPTPLQPTDEWGLTADENDEVAARLVASATRYWREGHRSLAQNDAAKARDHTERAARLRFHKGDSI